MEHSELLESVQVGRRFVDARQDVQHLAAAGAHIRGDIAVQRTRHNPAAAEVDRNKGYGTYRLPGRLKIVLDEISNAIVGEQHGSRQAGIRSAETVVQITHQLK